MLFHCYLKILLFRSYLDSKELALLLAGHDTANMDGVASLDLRKLTDMKYGDEAKITATLVYI